MRADAFNTNLVFPFHSPFLFLPQHISSKVMLYNPGAERIKRTLTVAAWSYHGTRSLATPD
jgi:hypothetical protein